MSKQILLNKSDMPTKWYNVLPDFNTPLDPPLNPKTKEPASPAELGVIFPNEIIVQEMSDKRFIDIPEEVLNMYAIWRATPLVRATMLEKYLNTPAKIYFKNESVSPPGSHKPNTAVAQSYYNMKEGVKRIATETGAGQWGSSLAFANQYFGIETVVYMVRVSYDAKPYRKIMMQTWGASVSPSPSNKTKVGRQILEKDPESPGSLGIAISEAVEEAVKREDTKYALGSVLNHVLLHQTIIGMEAKKQFESIDDYPDVVIGCVGGGSNFGGIALPFLADKFDGKNKNTRFVAVEPEACPTMTKGKYDYDLGDTAGLTPLVKMHSLGHDFVPPKIHAGGLRYHGMAPIISKLYNEKLIEAIAVPQTDIFPAAMIFAKTEGIIPAPESSHAIRGAIIEALKCKETGEEKTILFNLSGHGFFDMQAYQSYLAGEVK